MSNDEEREGATDERKEDESRKDNYAEVKACLGGFA